MYHLAIVDDHEAWCFVLSLRLQQQGYAVSTFTDAHAFLHKAAQFDLALVDFSMPAPSYQPDIDGPELIGRLKHQLDDPPVLVLISGFFTDDIINAAEDICPEADAVLSKQTEMAEICSTIQQLLAQRQPLKQKRHQISPSSSALADKLPVH